MTPTTPTPPPTTTTPPKRVAYTDDYFAKGHWGRKIWQTLIALLGWLAVLVPSGITITAFWASFDPRVWHLWSYREGLYEIKFIGLILLFAFAMASIFAVTMTIIQNRKRDRLVEQWPTFDPLSQRERKDVLDQFMTQRFGPAEFRENVKTYDVQPDQNLDTDQIHDLYAQRDLNDLDKE